MGFAGDGASTSTVDAKYAQGGTQRSIAHDDIDSAPLNDTIATHKGRRADNRAFVHGPAIAAAIVEYCDIERERESDVHTDEPYHVACSCAKQKWPVGSASLLAGAIRAGAHLVTADHSAAIHVRDACRPHSDTIQQWQSTPHVTAFTADADHIQGTRYAFSTWPTTAAAAETQRDDAAAAAAHALHRRRYRVAAHGRGTCRRGSTRRIEQAHESDYAQQLRSAGRTVALGLTAGQGWPAPSYAQ